MSDRGAPVMWEWVSEDGDVHPVPLIWKSPGVYANPGDIALGAGIWTLRPHPDPIAQLDPED